MFRTTSCVLVGVALVALFASGSPVYATLIAYDGFGQSGTLTGSSTGSGFSAPWNASTAFSLVNSTLPRPSDVEAAHPGATGRVQFSNVQDQYAIRQLTTPVDLGADATYYLSFTMHPAHELQVGFAKTPGWAWTNGRLVAGMASGGHTWLWQPHNETWVGTNMGATAYSKAVPRFYVMKIEASSAGTDNVYASSFPVDQPLLTEPTSWETALSGSSNGVFPYVQMRLNWAAAGFTGVDELRLGTTWGDVASAIPEPSTFALLSFGLVGLVWYGRRREAFRARSRKFSGACLPGGG
jgi:hypothetical protein